MAPRAVAPACGYLGGNPGVIMSMVDSATWAPDIRTRLYLWLSGVFVTCLVLANVAVSQLDPDSQERRE